MSPEQANAKQVHDGSGHWGMGAVLYELMTGKRAFGGDTALRRFVWSQSGPGSASSITLDG